ncbi:MAG: PRC-barrel domain-containing protein [Candidatus Binatia bacterium]
MKTWMAALVTGLLLAGAKPVSAQPVAGEVTLGVTAEELKVIVAGLSAKKDILGKAVYNDANERIGEIDDIIVTPNQFVSIAIIGVGGFLGIGEHHVAIPMRQLKPGDNKFVLPGATKDELKKLPPFKYAR